jgi:hypothetical protein
LPGLALAGLPLCAGHRAWRRGRQPQGAALDWRGLLLAAVGTLCLLNGLVELHGAPWRLRLLLLVAAGAWPRSSGGSADSCRPRAWQTADEPGAVRYRQFAMGSIVAFIYGTALFGSTYLLPVYMQLGLQLSAVPCGHHPAAAGLVLAVTIAGVGRLADRQPTHLLVSIGLALLALSFA